MDWLSNGSPPYAAYRAVNTVRAVALNKTPGVRPLGVVEVWMRLWSDCSHTKSKVDATNACGNTQLCAGLRSGIKANLHTVRAIWPQSAGWTADLGEEEDDGDQEALALHRQVRPEGMLGPGIDPGVAEDDSHSRYEEGMGFGSALFDARTSCCGTWLTCGIRGAGLRSTDTGTGFGAWCGRCQVILPLSSNCGRGSRRATASP